MHADSLTNVPDLIDAFGGTSAFARAIGKGQSTASEMKRAGRVDVSYWPKILAAAAGMGVEGLTSEHLMRMHIAEESPPAPAQQGNLAAEEAPQ